MKIESIIANVVDHTRDAVLVAEIGVGEIPSARVLWCNAGFTAMTGYAPEEIIGQSLNLLQGPDTCPEARRNIRRRIRAEKPVRQEILNYRKDGSSFWVDLNITPVADEHGDVRFWVSVQRDITALKLREQRAETALRKRLELERNLAKAVECADTAQRRLWHTLDAMSDGFALYDAQDRLVIANEAFHEIHGPIRAEISPGVSFETILRQGIDRGVWSIEGAEPDQWVRDQLALRAERDSVSAIVQLGDGRWMQRSEKRLPGGEMAGLFVDVTDLKLQQRELEETARLLEATREEFKKRAVRDDLTGIPNRRGLEELLSDRAESAASDEPIAVLRIDLDRFKQINDTLGHHAGDFILKAVVTLLRPLMEETDILARIGGEFFPFFQPQFDAVSLELVGVEALARWNHPTRGILSPYHFLDIAEDLNVVAELDQTILEQSVRQMRRLSAAGSPVPKISVNVSLKRLTDPDLLAGLDAMGANDVNLSFELLETIFLDEQDDYFDWCIDQLQERQIEIEVDDFGSGRASIVGLTRVRPKRLKIDRQLVLPITECASRRKLLTAIVDIGKSLGIGVTAEGVETMKHVELLREMGCDTVQGFALARPMPFEGLAELLAGEERRSA
ncbi:EAL domain-containing protein [Rhodobacteraceae bacterium NNCM2]|nr:EAL domain-containing protein [Coraliihabitans acroporae]